MDHVTLRMPVLVLAIAIDFHELLENRSLTAIAPLGEPR